MAVIPVKTAETYLGELQDNVTNQSTTVADVTTGGIVDVFLVPSAVGLEDANRDARRIEGLITLDSPETYTADELAGPLSRDGVTISEGSRATGTLVFYRTTPPTVDPDPIVRGEPVATQRDGRNQTVVVMATESREMTVATAPLYFVPARSRYELPVPAEAINSGKVGEVAPGRLTRPARGTLPAGWDGVTNLVRFSNGNDIETNTHAVGRAALSVRGRQKSTPVGIERTIRDVYNSIVSMRVVHGSDSRLTRAETQANAVDVWLKPTVTTAVTDTLIYSGAGALHVLSQQPVASITSVTIGGTVYDETTEWVFTVDESDERAGSVRATDGVVVLGAAAPTPTVGAIMTVVYEVHTSVRNAQALINDPANAPGGADVLVRAATPVDIYLGLSLRALTGASYSDVAAAVDAAVDTLINQDRALDDEIEGFDVARSVDNASVDNLSITRLSRDPADTTSTDVVIAFNEYARSTAANRAIVPM